MVVCRRLFVQYKDNRYNDYCQLGVPLTYQ